MRNVLNIQNTEKNKEFYKTERKAQAAIEYLMTYGWMLLAVAAIGGVTFQTIGGFQCVPTTSGFSGESVQVEDFGVSADNEFMLAIENRGVDTIELDEITVRPDGEQAEQWEDGIELGPGGQDSVSLDEGFYQTSETACSTIDVELRYDTGPLDGLSTTGQVVAPIERVDPDDAAEELGQVVSITDHPETIQETDSVQIIVEQGGETAQGIEIYVDGAGEETQVATTNTFGEATIPSTEFSHEYDYAIEAIDPEDPLDSNRRDLFELEVEEVIEQPEPPQIDSVEPAT